MKKYIIKQNLTDSEKYKLTLLIMLRAQLIRKMLRILLFPIVIISIIMGVTFGLGSTPDSSSTNILPVLIFPSIIILIFVLGPFIIIKLKKMDTPTYEFDDWGMTIINNNKTLNFPWQDISTYTELSNVFLITMTNSDLNTHIIPKNEFKDFNELKEFIDFLNRQRLKRK